MVSSKLTCQWHEKRLPVCTAATLVCGGQRFCTRLLACLDIGHFGKLKFFIARRTSAFWLIILLTYLPERHLKRFSSHFCTADRGANHRANRQTHRPRYISSNGPLSTHWIQPKKSIKLDSNRIICKIFNINIRLHFGHNVYKYVKYVSNQVQIYGTRQWCHSKNYQV